jgi:hypothetical protein
MERFFGFLAHAKDTSRDDVSMGSGAIDTESGIQGIPKGKNKSRRFDLAAFRSCGSTHFTTMALVASLIQRCRDSGTCAPSLLVNNNENDEGFEEELLKLMDPTGKRAYYRAC